MCGRYSVGEEFSELRLNGELVLFPHFAPRYNIAPSAQAGFEAPMVRLAPGGRVEGGLARFWFIPNWWRRPLKALPTSFNARGEELDTKPFFQAAFQRQRCLIPATGWREFSGPAGQKRAFQFTQPEPFTFAGLWDTFTTADGERADSFAIVTAAANATVSPYHDRMPVIMPPELREAWLQDDQQRQATLRQAIEAQASGLSVYEASRYGNSVRHEGPACIAPVEQQRALF